MTQVSTCLFLLCGSLYFLAVPTKNLGGNGSAKIPDGRTVNRNKLNFFAKSRLFVDTLFSSFTNFLVMFDINFALSVI